MIRIVTVSDTHNQLDKVTLPKGDVLFIVGDWTMGGTEREVIKFNYDVGQIKHNYTHGVYALAGNHDFLAQDAPSFCKSLLTNLTYLQDELIDIKGMRVYASPYSVEFGNWAFMLPRKSEQISNKWQQIPKDTDVILVHGPPNRILDKTKRGEYAGCEELTKRLKDVNYRLMVMGHIHEARGSIIKNGKLHINTSICNLNYDPINSPYVIDFNEKTKECKIVGEENSEFFKFEDHRRKYLNDFHITKLYTPSEVFEK